ncbi:MAG TPA: uracil phosphoribosyltransferase, partial [Gemmatimonadales bacterium]|nr:uracil phosphoribosyltransferase [Gemmatimonadales bacterium]
MTDPTFPNLTVLAHPLIQHKVSLLRSRDTGTRQFRQLIGEIAALMAYEVTQDLPTEPVAIDTPLEHMTGRQVATNRVTLVPILRAGLGMVDGIAQLLPTVQVGHLGLYRDHDSLEPVNYYAKLPTIEPARQYLVLDPMLATGGSGLAAVTTLKSAGAHLIRFLCIVAAPEGVRRMLDGHPDVPVFAAALDRELNADGYILPGL